MNGLKMLPTFVLKDNRMIMYNNLSWNEKNELNKHCKIESTIEGRPLYKKFYNEARYRIVKYGGNITRKEYESIKKWALEKGLYILVNSKDFNGHGSKWSSILLSETNLGKEFMEKHGIYECFSKLGPLQKIKRQEKMLGNYMFMPIKPNVKLGTNLEIEGCIYVSSEYAKNVNKTWKHKGIKARIIHGSKTAFVLKSLIFLVDNLDCDILIPEDENKLKLSAEQIANCFAINPDIDSAKSFSRNLVNKDTGKVGRKPKVAMDMALFMDFPLRVKKCEVFKKILMRDPSITTEEIAQKLFSYQVEDEEGNITIEYNQIGKRLLEVGNIFNPDIWPEASKVIANSIRKAIIPRVKGVYGQAFPEEFVQYVKAGSKIEYKKGYVIGYPMSVPIKTTVKILDNMIFINKELWKILGRDFDGDQIFFMQMKHVPCYFNWAKEEDRNELKNILQMAEKVKSKEEISLIDAQMIVNEQSALIGKIYNANKIILGAYIYSGKLSMKDLVKIDMYNNATLTQQAINGLKYSANEQIKTIDEDFIHEYNKQNAKKLGIERIPDIDNKTLNKVRLIYNTIKYTSNIENFLKVARKCDYNSKYFFERELSRFGLWSIYGQKKRI